MNNYWLIVERIENWEIDRSNQFSFFGIPEYKKKMSERMNAGDFLIAYVSSGIACFSDVRCVRPGGLLRLRHGGEYDTAFGSAIPTEPLITLPREAWLPMKDVAGKLEMTRGQTHWRHLVRQSIRSLSLKDGESLVREIKARSEASCG